MTSETESNGNEDFFRHESISPLDKDLISDDDSQSDFEGDQYYSQ